MLATARATVRRSKLSQTARWSCKPVCAFSTSFLDPTIRDFAGSLVRKQPCVAMSSDDIQVLSQPAQFYGFLLDMVRRAERRIFISSLYIGSEEHELIEALSTSLHNNSSLHVYLQLDLNRSTRPGPSSTAHLILPLLRDFPDRVHVSLFRSPKLRGVMAKSVPPRFNEGWGTWHVKIYGADDEVIISGANLNESYFTNRQDRYIHFKSQPVLAQYCFSFLQVISKFSYKLLPPASSTEEYSLSWPDSCTNAYDFQSKAATAFSEFQKSHLTRSNSEKGDVLVFPVIQAGYFNIREEERCLSLLFDHLAIQSSASSTYSPLMDLTSGYFGLYEKYQDLILRATINCRIIAASPKANGFFGSSGISGRIPEGYTFLEQRFMNAVIAAGRTWAVGKGILLQEWEKQGWTYHAKGIWLSPSPDAPPILTLFGSTNLNSRSAHLDMELSFIMLTSSPPLRQALRQEVQGLRAFASTWQGAKRRVRWGTKLLVSLMGGML